MRHVSCILLLEWSTTSQRLWVYMISVPYAQKDPRFLFKKRRGQPREFLSLVSTIDGSTLPQDCVEEQLFFLSRMKEIPITQLGRVKPTYSIRTGKAHLPNYWIRESPFTYLDQGKPAYLTGSGKSQSPNWDE